MANNNYKVFLYKPEAVSVTANNAGPYFLGELLVDNLDVSIKLQDISTVNFTLPRVINNTANTRIDEVLDGYVIELWYGDLSGTLNQDYYKYRFTIYTTPLSFTDDKFLHSYTGYSLEALTELKMLVSWPGIEISDFFRKVSYNNNGTTPKFIEAKNTSVGGNFEYTITTSGSGSHYITLTPTTAVAADIDIFVYEVRQRLTSGSVVSESEAGLIPYSGTGPNDSGFKNGFYFLTISGGFVTQIHVALPDNYTSFNGQSVSSQLLFFKLYDNPLSRRYAIGITTNAEQANDMYINLAHDVATGSPTDFNNFNFQTQTFYSKNGLTLKQVLLGKENTTVNSITEDGLLYNTGFTLGTIDSSLLNQYRSNLEFNNLTRYVAIKNLAESFDAVTVYDTVNNTVSFYPENIYGVNNGLIIRYGAYLKALNKEIDASKIITNAIGLGKDNLTIALVSPTGLNYWEDYSYYLDDYYIESAAEIGTITEDASLGITFNYASTSGYSSRWMSASLAEKVGKWQYTRDWFHSILTGEYNPTGFSSTITQFYNFYENRLNAIRLLIKKETEYFTALKKEVKYEAFKNYYDKLSKDNPSITTYSTKLSYYTGQLNNAKTSNLALLSTLNANRNSIFDKNTVGSYAAKMVILQGFLKKDSVARAINLDSLRTFQRETVVNDSSVDDEKDLLEIVKTHVDENKEPKVTISIDVADILAAQEAQEDWKKVKVGDKINIYLDELNVDVVAQIREINVNFEEHTLGFVISTVRNYNRGFGNFVLKTIRNLYNSNNNNVAYEIDGSRYSKTTSQNINEILQNGINTGDTTVTSGLQDDAGNSGTEINGSGTSTASIASVDDLTESVTAYVSPATQGVIVVDGKLLAYHNYTSPTAYSSEVEISADTGFTIRKISGGTITKQVYIDTDGNAVFAGNLSAGVAGQFDPAGSAATAQIAAQDYANGIKSELQGQIDGAISTFFAEGIPLPFTAGLSGTTLPVSGVEGQTFYDTDDNKYYIFNNDLWVEGFNSIIDSTDPWPTDDVEFYQVHTGDIYYDNLTGYAYRFSQTVFAEPDVVTNYKWVQISDGAATAALAAAATKITVFTASDATSYNTNINSNIKDKDIFMPTGTATALASANTASLSADFAFIKNDTYVYNETPKTFTKLQNVEEKDTGKVAGWEISAADIKAKNGVMVLHSDSDDTSTPGEQPYLSISQGTSPGYGNVGIFLGRVLDVSTYFPKLSMVNTGETNYLKWTGTQLDIRGTINATAGNFINEVTIGSGSTLGKLLVGTDANVNNKIIIEGGNTAGTTKIYSGVVPGTNPPTGQFNNANTSFYIDAEGRFSLGDKLAFTKAGGGSLSVTASIAGDISGITVGAIEISPSGITTTTNKFSVSSVTGEINSTGGTIGGFTIGSTTLTAGTTSGNFLGMSPGAGTSSNISFWAGASRTSINPPTAAQISAAPFRVTNTGEITASTGKIGNLTILNPDSLIGLSSGTITKSGRFAPLTTAENYTGILTLNHRDGLFFDRVNSRQSVNVNEERYVAINTYPVTTPTSTYIPSIEVSTNNVLFNAFSGFRSVQLRPDDIRRIRGGSTYTYNFPSASGTISLGSQFIAAYQNVGFGAYTGSFNIDGFKQILVQGWIDDSVTQKRFETWVDLTDSNQLSAVNGGIRTHTFIWYGNLIFTNAFSTRRDSSTTMSVRTDAGGGANNQWNWRITGWR
jgi:hypothetical protein